MRNPILARLLCFAMSVLILVGSCTAVMAADETESDGESGKKTSIDEVKEVLDAASYEEYYLSVKDLAPKASEEITYSAAETLDKEQSVKEAEIAKVKDETGKEIDAVTLPDSGTAFFKVNVPTDGLYTVRIMYVADGSALGSDSTIERSFRLDGKLPFSEARSIELRRAWQDVYLTTENSSYKVLSEKDGKKYVDKNNEKFVDSDGIIKYVDRTAMLIGDKKTAYPANKWDINGNDIRLNKEQIAGKLVEAYFTDSTGYTALPFEFYFTAGEHVLSLEAVREEFQLVSFTLGKQKELKSYEEYKKANSGKANNASETIFLEAEFPTATSDKSIYAISDRSSAITSPQDPSETRLNTIGASKWQEIGQWISYDIDVPADGFYNISLRFMQSTMEGLFTSRKLLIDGECPFDGAAALRFNYSRKWQLQKLSDSEGNAYEFYLTKGKHTISFEVVLGDMASIIAKVSETNSHINSMYLDILMLTGSDPDAYIEYEFIKNLPEVVRGLREESKNLYDVAAELTEIVGQSGSNTATLEKTAYLCKKIGYDTDLIARNLDRLKSDVGTIGTWIQSVSKQPLTVDYILVTPASKEKISGYKGDANVFEALGFEFKSFIMSFFTDYTSIGVTVDTGDLEKDDVVEVWYAVDRDRASVIRQMIDNDFTPNTGIAVNFKLVAGGSLLPSILAGVGPDVMIGLGSSDVINYSIRGAVKSLSDFDDAEEVVKQYKEAAVTPLRLYDNLYGLPMTMNFPMLYYRADVLLELGLDIPETWEDFYDMIPAILANKLDIGYPVGETGLYLFLFQTGESLYKNYTVLNADNTKSEIKGMQINLDSNTALSCFKKMCDLITLYDLPLSYSFPNRFRTGEMPLGIQDISLYNELTLFAPEIAGLWGMVAVPGTEDDKGEIDYSSPVTVAATVIIKSKDENHDYSKEWEFVKWWSGNDAQSEFGSEVVSIMGDGAKYFTANTAALESLPWTKSEYDNIMYQFNKLSAKPEMPGGYIITRYVTFAYQAVYNQKKDSVNEMYSYIDEINAELTRKRIEFELATIDDFTENENGELVPKQDGMKLAEDGRLYTLDEYKAKYGN